MIAHFENVTIYTQGGFGITRTDVKTLTIETTKWAQYPSALKVTFKQPRQRNMRGMYLTYAPFLVVVRREDAIDPDDAFLPAQPGATPGVSIARGRYSACDPRWTSDFAAKLAARGIEPLFSAEGHDTMAAAS